MAYKHNIDHTFQNKLSIYTGKEALPRVHCSAVYVTQEYNMLLLEKKIAQCCFAVGLLKTVNYMQKKLDILKRLCLLLIVRLLLIVQNIIQHIGCLAAATSLVRGETFAAAAEPMAVAALEPQTSTVASGPTLAPSTLSDLQHTTLGTRSNRTPPAAISDPLPSALLPAPGMSQPELHVCRQSLLIRASTVDFQLSTIASLPTI